MHRLFLIPLVFAVCLAAVPIAVVPATRSIAVDIPPSLDRLPTVAEFELLIRRDPIAAFDACLSRYRVEVHGYRCTFQKQECLNGRLGEVEVISLAVREEPFAVYMAWTQGAGTAKAIVYARGENGGRMKVKTSLLVLNTDPLGVIARSSSRYCIDDSGVYNAALRTRRAWAAARDRGALNVEYLGTKAVPECGGAICHILKRTCEPAEVDNFRSTDLVRREPGEHPKEAFRTVTLYIDAANWLQLGSVLHQADGSLQGAYYHRDMALNPAFPPEQFTPAAVRK